MTELKYKGFSLAEIAVGKIEGIIFRHAEEAAFLWLLRDAAVRAPQYKLKDLAKLDERVEAHLGGLRESRGATGWVLCARTALEEGKARTDLRRGRAGL